RRSMTRLHERLRYRVRHQLPAPRERHATVAFDEKAEFLELPHRIAPRADVAHADSALGAHEEGEDFAAALRLGEAFLETDQRFPGEHAARVFGGVRQIFPAVQAAGGTRAGAEAEVIGAEPVGFVVLRFTAGACVV